jgi:L-ribulose-5-phosphate 4-epimerase
MLLQAVREELVKLNQALPENGLVTWTSGNVSIRDLETGHVVIKASGVKFPDLTPESMVVVDLEGNVLDGDLKPSSDAASHLYIYRHRPDVGGVVHTHSNYATAFAALGKPIPVYLTAQADEFGGPIPCGGFAGVFTVGPTADVAVKSAVMVEDVARTVWLALQLGQPEEIAPEDVVRLHHRYTHEYGQ